MKDGQRVQWSVVTSRRGRMPVVYCEASNGEHVVLTFRSRKDVAELVKILSAETYVEQARWRGALGVPAGGKRRRGWGHG